MDEDEWGGLWLVVWYGICMNRAKQRPRAASVRVHTGVRSCKCLETKICYGRPKYTTVMSVQMANMLYTYMSFSVCCLLFAIHRFASHTRLRLDSGAVQYTKLKHTLAFHAREHKAALVQGICIFETCTRTQPYQAETPQKRAAQCSGMHLW